MTSSWKSLLEAYIEYLCCRIPRHYVNSKVQECFLTTPLHCNAMQYINHKIGHYRPCMQKKTGGQSVYKREWQATNGSLLLNGKQFKTLSNYKYVHFPMIKVCANSLTVINGVSCVLATCFAFNLVSVPCACTAFVYPSHTDWNDQQFPSKLRYLLTCYSLAMKTSFYATSLKLTSNLSQTHFNDLFAI